LCRSGGSLSIAGRGGPDVSASATIGIDLGTSAVKAVLVDPDD
jgi:activator of 2-hydroxyglutaryl-CoA dehydratase